jgi:hypothetical protein
VTSSVDTAVPAAVSLHLYGTTGVLAAVNRMARDRGRVRRLPGCSFAKLLGTGSGATFTMRDADLHHWAILTCWTDHAGPARFEASATHRAWSELSHEQASFRLRPLAARGTWSGLTPFGDPVTERWAGAVAALTRARIKPRHWPTFWRAVPAVSADLHAGDGVLATIGIGEAPVGLQGTFSIWRDSTALNEFAYGRSPHQEVVRRTTELGWYAEELFARFAVLDTSGTYRGRSVQLPRAGENGPLNP